MEISARNALKGTVKAVNVGSVNDEIILEIVPGIEVVSIGYLEKSKDFIKTEWEWGKRL